MFEFVVIVDGPAHRKSPRIILTAFCIFPTNSSTYPTDNFVIVGICSEFYEQHWSWVDLEMFDGRQIDLSISAFHAFFNRFEHEKTKRNTQM